MLLAAAEIQPNWHFVGQDVDLRCARMTAINLGLRNLYGHVAWANTLTLETKAIYETGRVQLYGNVIRKANRIPLPKREPEISQTLSEVNPDEEDGGSTSQLQLF